MRINAPITARKKERNFIISAFSVTNIAGRGSFYQSCLAWQDFFLTFFGGGETRCPLARRNDAKAAQRVGKQTRLPPDICAFGDYCHRLRRSRSPSDYCHRFRRLRQPASA